MHKRESQDSDTESNASILTSDSDKDDEEKTRGKSKFAVFVLPTQQVKYIDYRRVRLIVAERPRTNLSFGQGDHVSAFRLFSKGMLKQLRHLPAQAAYNKLIRFIRREGIIEEKDLDSQLQENTKILSGIIQSRFIKDVREGKNDKEEKKPEERILLAEALKRSNTALYSLAASRLSDLYLKARNRQPYTAFQRVKSEAPAKGEAARIHKAITKLTSIHHKLKSKIQDELNEKEKVKYIKMEKNEIVNVMNKTFFYPKIKGVPVKEKMDDKAEKKAIEEEKKGKRTNNLDTLKIVLVLHIKLIFNIYFPLFWKWEEVRDAIIEAFLKNVCQQWELDANKINKVCDGVKQEIARIYQELKTDIGAEEKQEEADRKEEILDKYDLEQERTIDKELEAVEEEEEEVEAEVAKLEDEENHEELECKEKEGKDSKQEPEELEFVKKSEHEDEEILDSKQKERKKSDNKRKINVNEEDESERSKKAIKLESTKKNVKKEIGKMGEDKKSQIPFFDKYGIRHTKRVSLHGSEPKAGESLQIKAPKT